MGAYESALALLIGAELIAFVTPQNLGTVFGADAPLRILPGKVRMPDVAFVRRERMQAINLPDQPVPPVVPDLAIEVLSAGNTRREMELKLQQYFEAGVRKVWFVLPLPRSARSFSGIDEVVEVSPDGFLTAEDVLPGFRLSLARIFELADKNAGK